MAVYEYSTAVSALGAANPYVDMLATTSDAVVREIQVFNTTAVASSITLFRTTAIGTRTTPTVPTAAQCALSGTGNNPLAGFATAWSVNPTNATNPMRKFQTAASIGAGVVWTWYGPNGGLRVPAGASIVLHNLFAGVSAALNVTFVWEE